MGKKLTAEEIGQHVIKHPNKGFDQCNSCQGIEPQGKMYPDNEELDFDSLICDECIEKEEKEEKEGNLVDQKFSKYLATLKDQTVVELLGEVVFSLPEKQRREVILKHLPEVEKPKNKNIQQDIIDLKWLVERGATHEELEERIQAIKMPKN